MAVKMVDVDLSGDRALAAPSSRYSAVRLLVRDGGTALGYLQLPNRPELLEPDALARAIVESDLTLAVWRARVARRFLDAAGEGAAHGSARAGALPSISVVVCTRDRPSDLADCLRAISSQDYPTYEIVVVDNGSRDESARRLAQRFGALYVLERRSGLNYARNAGWNAAHSAIVAYADDDTRPDPGWLAGIASGFAATDIAAVTGLVVPAELETRAQLLFEDAYGGMGKGFEVAIHTRRGRHMTYRPDVYGVGCNMAFRREALTQVGGFDPVLDVGTPTGGGGDFDILQRIVETDQAICYRPDAIVRHVHRRTGRQLRRQAFDNGRGVAAFLLTSLGRARRGDKLRVLRHALAWSCWLVVRVLRALFRRTALPLPVAFAELVGGMIGPFAYIASRRRARRLRRHPDFR